MNFLSHAFSWLAGWATRQAKGDQVPVPSTVAFEDTPNVGIDAALQVSTVWACVKLLSETIASLPLFVYRTDGNGMRTLARDSQLFTVLHDSPNNRQTAQEFWEFMLLNYFLRGNAYARIVRKPNGEVSALWPMSADQVKVTILETGALAYTYTLDNKEFVFADSEVLHLRGMGSDAIGMSPLDYMRGSVSLGIKAQSHTSTTYSKNARRPGLLMSDNVLTDDQRKALKANFGEIATGGKKELYVLEAGFRFEPLGMTPADLQLLETRRFSVEDIARFFGVPSVMVNDTAGATTWGTGIGQIIEGFHKFTVRPQVERFEQALAKRVLTQGQRREGLTVEFSLDALLRASIKDRMEVYAKGVQNGIYTRNECRQLENLPKVSGADELTAQVNLRPLDMLRTLDQKTGGEPPVQPEQQ